ILLAGLALETAGLVRADAERQWAGEIIRYLIHSQPTPTTTYNAGDWYAYPAPFPGKTIFYLAESASSDPAAKSYANQITQTYAGAPNYQYLELLFHDPEAKAKDWSTEPLQYFAPGGGLLLARSDWGANPVWLSVQFSNLLKAGHSTIPPGQIQIQRGPDDLLVNAASVAQTQSGQAKSTFGNSIVVDDNGDQSQTYRWAMGFWYGTPGVVVNDYQVRADYVYVSGNYKAAYSHNRAPDKGGPVTELNRQVVYLRPNWVVVYDRVTTVKESYPKQQRWH